MMLSRWCRLMSRAIRRSLRASRSDAWSGDDIIGKTPACASKKFSMNDNMRVHTVTRVCAVHVTLRTSRRQLLLGTERTKTGELDLNHDRCKNGGVVPMDAFQHLTLRGEGTYGRVYTGIAQDGAFVAIKQFKASLISEEGCPPDTCREIAALRALPLHYNVVEVLRTASASDGTPLMVMPGAERHMGSYKTAVDVPTSRRLIRHVCSGVAHLHAHGIIHRDIKPQNTLIYASPSGPVAKVADFGLARVHVPGRLNTLEVTTLWYRAPEVLLGLMSYDQRLDVWAIGLMLLQLLSGSPTCTGCNEWEQLVAYFKLIGTPDETIWPGVGSLPNYSNAWPTWPTREVDVNDTKLRCVVQRALTFDPARRADAYELQERLSDDEDTRAPRRPCSSKIVAGRAPSAPDESRGWNREGIKKSMRPILVEWMVEVTYRFKISARALHIAVALVDAYVARCLVATRELQMFGVASLWIACKLEEQTVCEARDLTYITNEAYTSTEIIAAEAQILRTLDYACYVHTIVDELGVDVSMEERMCTDLALLVPEALDDVQTAARVCRHVALRLQGDVDGPVELVDAVRKTFEGRVPHTEGVRKAHKMSPSTQGRSKKRQLPETSPVPAVVSEIVNGSMRTSSGQCS
jgi:serine/threonine protein kinase